MWYEIIHLQSRKHDKNITGDGGVGVPTASGLVLNASNKRFFIDKMPQTYQISIYSLSIISIGRRKCWQGLNNILLYFEIHLNIT